MSATLVGTAVGASVVGAAVGPCVVGACSSNEVLCVLTGFVDTQNSTANNNRLTVDDDGWRWTVDGNRWLLTVNARSNNISGNHRKIQKITENLGRS